MKPTKKQWSKTSDALDEIKQAASDAMDELNGEFVRSADALTLEDKITVLPKKYKLAIVKQLNAADLALRMAQDAVEDADRWLSDNQPE